MKRLYPYIDIYYTYRLPSSKEYRSNAQNRVNLALQIRISFYQQ